MRLRALVVIAGLAALAAAARPASATEPRVPAPAGTSATEFAATCEDVGRFCFADACGRDQIEAAQECRVRCPGSVVMSVVPAACPVPDVVLRRRG